MMPTRIFGKPFTVTEFNFCNPNRFRAEGGPLMGAYAALQNWGGLWRFCWSHSDAGIIRNPGQNSFDASNDPMQQLSDRIILALFLRGDLAPSKTKISYPVAPFSQIIRRCLIPAISPISGWTPRSAPTRRNGNSPPESCAGVPA